MIDAPFRVLLSTAPADVAEEIAKKAVESRLAACVNVVPNVTSIYTWEGKVERAAESLLVIKTRRGLVDELTAFLRSIHPYAVPEVLPLAVAPGEGSRDYLAWLLAATRDPRT